jgi:hypothetical protein
MAQVLKLGLTGSETTLPSQSRRFNTSGNSLISTEGRAADGTLHVDFVNSKRSFSISYAVVSETNKDLITSIYQLQISNGSFLSFIYTDESGSDVTVTVKMSAPVFGAINPKNTFYYNGTSIELEEV